MSQVAGPLQGGVSLAGVELHDETDSSLLQALVAELEGELDKAGHDEGAVGVEQDEETRRACKQAALLFIGQSLLSFKEPSARPSGLSISRIVATCTVNLLDFFHETRVVLGKLSPWLEARGSSVREFTALSHLKEYSDMIVVLGLLAKKYKDHFNTCFHQLDFYKQVVLRMGWLLFLVLKSRLLSKFPDLISCMELLPCVFYLLLSNSPKQPSLANAGSANQLRALSDLFKADFQRVAQLMHSVQVVASPLLASSVPEWRQGTNRQQAESSTPEAGTDGGSTTTTSSNGSACSDSTNTTSSAPPAANSTASNMAFEGLVSNIERMNLVISVLEREYEAVYSRGGQLDERDFLSLDFNKLASPRFSPSAIQSAVTQLQKTTIRPGALLGPGAHTTASPNNNSCSIQSQYPLMGLPLGLHSPLPMMHLGHPGQATPVSEAMGCVSWLRGVTVSLLPEASPTLHKHFAACEPNPAQVIVKRAKDMVSAVFVEESHSLQPFPLFLPSPVSERRTETLKLYYHVLEAMVLTEDRQGLGAAAPMLTSIKFHRGLMACCCEVVGASYRIIGNTFPRLLDVLRIKAFDVAKMLHNFVRHLTSMPREIKRHLFVMEERIIEQLAWEAGSPLYNVIMTVTQERSHDSGADGVAPGARQDARSSHELQHAHSSTSHDMGVPASLQPPLSPKRHASSPSFSSLVSPAKKARGQDSTPHVTQQFSDALPVGVGTPPHVNGSPPSQGAALLYDFLRKLLKLVAFRLSVLCDSFDFSPISKAEVNTRVYETIEHALYHQTHLFYNRHIDQIILSALYGFCKVHKLNQISFKEIITQYRKQPQSNQQVFRSVIIDQSNPGLQVSSREDIIAFYNKTFVPAMKAYLLKSDGLGGLTAMGSGVLSGLPPLPPKAPVHMHSPRRQAVAVRTGSAGAAPHRSASMPHTAHAGNSGTLPAAGGSGGLLGHATAVAGSTVAGPSRAGKAKASGSAGSPVSSEASPKIPDGLAALLMALDNQQQVAATAGAANDSSSHDSGGGSCSRSRAAPDAMVTD